jgi:hypothetical protein
MLITLPSKLMLVGFDTLYKMLAKVPTNEPLELDMSALKFAEPAGLLPFVCFVRKHIRAGGAVAVSAFPAKPEVCGYLERINFYQLIGCPCPHGPGARLSSEDKFIEITEITSGQLTEKTKHSLYSLAKAKMEINSSAGKSFLTACGELIHNTRHAYNVSVDPQADSRPSALVLAQYYRHSHTLHFTVADCGVGIHRSLSAKDPNKFKNEKQAIHAATILNVKSPVAIGRGVGLAAIRRFMRRNGGRFTLTSGAWSVVFTPYKRNSKIPVWNGSIISLEIKCNKNVDLSTIIKGMAQR